MESEGKVIWRVVWENDCESGWERGDWEDGWVDVKKRSGVRV